MFKRIAAVFFAAALVFTMASCKSNTSSTSSTASEIGGKNITVWLGSWWLNQQTNIQNLYAAANPGYTCNVQLQPVTNYLQNATTAIVGGTPPDALDLDTLMIPTPISQNLLRPLDSFMKAYGMKASDFPAGMYSPGVAKGKTYGIPDRAAVTVLMYNKAMFDKAGVTYPTNSWTLDDLLTNAQKLTVSGKQWGWGIAATNSDPANVMTSFLPILWGEGGDVLNKGMTASTMGTTQGIAAIKYYSELYNKYHVVPDGTLNYTITRDLIPMFQNGTLAMCPMNDSNITPTITAFAAKNWQWGTVLLPPGGMCRAGGWTLTIPTTAKNVTGAEKFISFFINPNYLTSQNIVMPGPNDCQGRGVWSSDIFKIFYQTFPMAKIAPPTPAWTNIQNILVVDLQKALQGTMTPDAAGKDLDTQINAALKSTT